MLHYRLFSIGVKYVINMLVITISTIDIIFRILFEQWCNTSMFLTGFHNTHCTFTSFPCHIYIKNITSRCTEPSILTCCARRGGVTIREHHSGAEQWLRILMTDWWGRSSRKLQVNPQPPFLSHSVYLSLSLVLSLSSIPLSPSLLHDGGLNRLKLWVHESKREQRKVEKYFQIQWRTGLLFK